MQPDVLRVLPFVIQCLVSPADFCRSLQTCKSWNDCLAECPPCLSVGFSLDEVHDLRTIAIFADWLQRYGNLVEALDISWCEDCDSDTIEDVMAVAEKLIADGLQLAAAKLRPLQLTCVQKERLDTLTFLPSLPAASLTSLVLSQLPADKLCTRALAGGLGRLSNLRKLTIKGGGWEEEANVFPASCLSGLRQLSALTYLELVGYLRPWGPGLEEHLPAKLQIFHALSIQALTGDLRHLTSLSSLNVSADQLSLTQLPPQLQQLSVSTSGECLLCLSNVAGLSSLSVHAPRGLASGSCLPLKLPALALEHTPLPVSWLFGGVVTVSVASIPAQPSALWKQLGSSSCLEELSLQFDSLGSAAASAPAWGDLPSLKVLRIQSHSWGAHEQLGEEDAGYLATIVSKLSCAQSLRCLSLTMYNSDMPCSLQVSKLTGLQSLNLSHSRAGMEDLLQLANLSQLTELVLSRVNADDAVCAFLACSLTQLRCLIIAGSPLSVVSLVIISNQLRNLRFLRLDLAAPITDASLPYMVQLTHLTTLMLTPCSLSSDGLSRLRRGLMGCQLFL